MLLLKVTSISIPWSKLIGASDMRIKIAIVAAIACLLSAPAFAQGAPPTFSFANGSNSARASSWLAGGQLGYDWQYGAFVYGLEADLSGMNLKSEMNDGLTFTIPVPASASTTAKVNWYGTVRARLGWATGPLLLYATGGLAYGKVELSSNFDVAFPPTAIPGSLDLRTSPVKTGWVAGGGLEYKLLPNLTLNLEYQYVDLGTVNLASSTIIPIAPPVFVGRMSESASVHAQFQAVTAGLNWYFAPTDTARPWAGWFVGGHGGGAWGDSASASYASSCVGCVPSDVRLKRDIVLVGRLDDGLGIYRYRYLWSKTVYVGVLAQEVALDHPDAVVRGPFGYLMVDYGKLGLRMMTEREWDAVRDRRRLALCCSQ